jgi:membrane protein implicated in regulation of membrane protease activity
MNERLFNPPLRGKVEETITPNQPGRVQAMGSYWYAQCYGWNYRQTLYPGQVVMVIAQQGRVLLVMPIAES